MRCHVVSGSTGAAVAKPKFERIGASSVVFEPVDEPPLNDDFRGTEDPRIAFDPATQTYYMCVNHLSKDSDCRANVGATAIVY